MPALKLCKQYLSALNAGNLDGILALFAPEASVVCPILGKADARTYFQRVLTNTDRSINRLLNVFEPVNKAPSIALHFHYTWVPKQGRGVEFECVNVFELTANRTRFAKLTTLYDPTPVRQYLAELGHLL